MHYVAIKSALQVQKSDAIYLYNHFEPEGFWWEEAKKLVTAEKIKEVNSVYGHGIPRVEHRADVVRLQELVERGGIYHDIDVISLRRYPDEWLESEFVMGRQLQYGTRK